MKDEGNFVAIFSILFLIVILAIAFPEKIAFLFESEIYLAAISLIIFLVFFYLWLRLKRY